MKITVKIDSETFEVEVGDIHERPILAMIGEERFEVWPEDVVLTHPAARATSAPVAAPRSAPAATPAAPVQSTATAGRDSGQAVLAPIPGVIISVAVKPGEVVKHGQELCILEAMKMKNVIRATRAGTIGVVHTAAQQHVKHHDVLMEYTD